MNVNSRDDQNFLDKLTAIIDVNLSDENFSVEKLAELAGLSRSMLHRRLKKLTGKSATEVITETRLEKAKDLLMKGDFTSAEIAYKVGFSSPSYFNKVFKKHFKISPGEVVKGKKVDFGIQNKKRKNFKGNLKSIVLVALIVVLAALAGILAIHFFRVKTDLTEKSIAILPFDNLSSNENNQYFADGIVEDLLTRLSTFENLKVISRTSSEMFREKGDKTVPGIAKILGVDYIVEGSVQIKNENIRISIQLIDAKKDDHILSKQYDRNLNDVFEVQSEIVQQIVSELSLVLTDRQLNKLEHNYTKNIKALQLYQVGRFHSSKRTAEGYKMGIEYYWKAIAEDPAYALAYAGLADNYDLMSLQGHINRIEGNKIARVMAEKALEIDPDLSEAHTVLGSFYTYTDWKWKEAEKELLKATELNPNYSTAHQYYAEYLTIMGRDEEARQQMNEALKLDPFSFITRWRSGRIYYDQEQFDEALSEIKVCLDLNKEHPWALNLEFDIYLALKNDSAVLDNLRRSSGVFGMWTSEEADSVYQIGGIDGIKRWVAGLNTFEPEYTKAIFYGMLGEYENAMDMLEMAMEANALSVLGTTNLEYKPLRSNPRFKAIREKMGLPPLEP